jgi:hypothetical protein
MALLNGPEENATYADIASQMIALESEETWRAMIREQFRQREIIDGPTGIAADLPQALNWSQCCATLNDQKRIQPVNRSINRVRKKREALP